MIPVEIIGSDLPHEGSIQMGVWIQTAWHDQKARGIDELFAI